MTLPLLRPRFGRSAEFPITVRPTRADVAIARTIARRTEPVPEEVAGALTWGAFEGLRRTGNHALLVTVAAASHEIAVRPDPPRPQDGDRSCARRLVFGKARGCLSVRTRVAHGGVCFRSGHSAVGAAKGCPWTGDRSFADEDLRACALGERRRGRLRARCHSRTHATPVDRVSPRIAGGRPRRTPTARTKAMPVSRSRTG